MVHLFIGAFMMGCFLLVVNHTRTHERHIFWWQWILTILGFIYTVFVLEIILSFIAEGSVRGVLVMGLFIGFIAIVWGVLLARFVFKQNAR